ncbi:amidohydrolase family protein [Rhodococcus erythropolis]|uniref:amidohydrolase n=1 Tax=Rhodococcus erythropolis TaxID=1833 RepID=UPI001E3CC19D|nr:MULTISPECIES: amidohydrolase family protein [Rhodococcus erythropolis group]MCD2109286.1 amidohydrolase family protein [Rhodococcus qingshengii]MCZ4528210.1 amidohydrolase family protein [Rhodococcus erythropolis]
MSRTLIRSGKILTFDDTNPVAEAVLVEDGKILEVGSFADLSEHAGRGTQVMDTDGAVVMPGLIDTHPHVMHFGALRGGLVDLSDAVDHPDIVERIRAQAADTPPGEWIICTPVGEAHYFIRRSWRDLAERRLPDRHTLDQATSDHPVLIQAWAPHTPNIVAFNSAGLRAVGLSDFIPDQVCDVEIDKDEAGRLTGILRGPVNNYYTYDPFWGQILLKLPPLNPDHAVPGVLEEMARFSARGVTTLYEGHAMEPIHIQMYQHLRSAGLLTMRVQATHDVESVIFYPFEPLSSREFDERLKSLAPQSSDTTDDLFRIDGMTISPGGPCFAGHFAMHENYSDPFGRPTKGNRFVSLEKEESYVRFCAENGIRANVCIGSYREHDDFLAIAERVVTEHDFRHNKWILQHAITISPDHVRRYKNLGFQVTTSVGFAWGKGAMYDERIGRHVWRDMVPLRRLLDAGLDVSGGSDWGPKSPWEQIALAQTHEIAGTHLRNDGPDQVITRAESLAMWTTSAAKILGWNGIGSIRPGNHADLIVVDRDPLTCDLDDLKGTRVQRTLLSGNIVHDDATLPACDKDPR